MPACYVKNCKSRTDNPYAKNIKLFRFPKEGTIRQRWLEACKRDEVDIKIDSTRICSLHFKDDCFEMKWTKPRGTNTSAKEICRLKKNSVPSELLNLEIKGKENKNEVEGRGAIKMKAEVITGIPTYNQLLKYVEEKQQIQNVQNTNVQNHTNKERSTNKDIFGLNTTEEETNKMNEVNINESNNSIEILMNLLEKEKREKEILIKNRNELLQEKQKLVGKNEQLNQEVEQLRKDVQHKSEIITQMVMEKEKEDEKVPLYVLRKVFTLGQIKLLMSQNPNTRIKWSAEDITSAIALRSLSPKAYRYLRNVKNMPLPCVTTLQNWCATFRIPPGILKDVFQIMKDKGQNLCAEQRLTVLTFDELYISNKIDFERKEQKIYGPHKTCQFVMARGLFEKWKQPIYYEFDKPISAHTLLTLINSLYDVNYIVLAVTCDMGPTNMKLWNDLNIGINVTTGKNMQKSEIEKRNWIAHPSDESLQIFFFADVPHLLKLARNNLFDSGFKIKGSNINKTCLEELLTLHTGELKIAHKLSVAHLDVKGSQRQNVKMAAQVLSNRNALDIRWCGEKGLLKCPQWEQTANVLKLFNDWFDIFNSRCKYGKSRKSIRTRTDTILLYYHYYYYYYYYQCEF